MIAVTRDWRIVHASENAAEFLGLEDPILGETLPDILTGDTMHSVRSQLLDIGDGISTGRIFDASLGPEQRKLNISLHVSGDLYVLELERSIHSSARGLLSKVHELIDRISAVDDMDPMLDCAALSMKQLLNFESVMIYRSSGDGTGKIVAEALNGDDSPNLGLKFRESDLLPDADVPHGRPVPRVIQDVYGEALAIASVPGMENMQLNLSNAVSRAASGPDLQFLRDSGVSAYLTVPIVQNERPWGRFVCYHDNPCDIGVGTRSAVELFAELFSQDLSERAYREDRRVAARIGTFRRELFSRRPPPDPIEDFDALYDAISALIKFDGFAIYSGGEHKGTGLILPPDQFRAVSEHLREHPRPEIFATDRLQETIPGSAEFAGHIAGTMVIQTSFFGGSLIALFRREEAHAVNWASRGSAEGFAETQAPAPASGKIKSRRTWKELILGRSKSWRRREVSAAEAIRSAFLEADLHRAGEVQKATAELQQNLLRALRGRGMELVSADTVGPEASALERHEARTAQDAVNAGLSALDRALAELMHSNWGPTSAQRVIRAGLAPLTEGGTRLSFEGKDWLVTASAVIALTASIHDLLWDEVSASEMPAGSRLLSVAVSVTHTATDDKAKDDASAQATVRTSGSGTTLDIRLPREFVVRAMSDTANETALRGPYLPNTAMQGTTVLLVEDDTPVALKTAEQLRDAGVARVKIAANVTDALKMLDGFQPDVALLDINMGTETSKPVATRLSELGVPVLLVTGYSIDDAMLGDFSHVGKLIKPYTTQELMDNLNRATVGRNRS